jgi:hypothetical protein
VEGSSLGEGGEGRKRGPKQMNEEEQGLTGEVSEEEDGRGT